MQFNLNATPYIPKKAQAKIKYSRDALLLSKQRLHFEVLQNHWDCGTVLAPLNLISKFARYLQLRCNSEFVNLNSDLLAACGGGGQEEQVPVMENDEIIYDPRPPFTYCCFECASASSPNGCSMIMNLIKQVKAAEKLTPFLHQSKDVVFNSIRIQWAFEHRKASSLVKQLPAAAMKLIKLYLLGEGFHIPPPAIVDTQSWKRHLERLKFDWIRDNRTRVRTDISKYWKKSHTYFEQFVHFLFFSEDQHLQITKGMLTNSQKPLLIACISGDISAVVLLSELGFDVLPDMFWDILPYCRDALSLHDYTLLRHLCIYFFKRRNRHVILT